MHFPRSQNTEVLVWVRPDTDAEPKIPVYVGHFTGGHRISQEGEGKDGEEESTRYVRVVKLVII